jgi:hypothetical protein
LMRRRSRGAVWSGIKALTCLASIVVLAIAIPSAARGALPTPSSDLIVPGVSVGGVALGSSLAEATAAWGKGGVCKADPHELARTECTYANTGKLRVDASIGLEESTVVTNAFLSAFPPQTTQRTPDFSTSLTRVKTANGIHIGSTLNEVLAAYPQTKRTVRGGGTLSFYGFKSPDGNKTEFELFKSSNGNRLVAIGVSSPEKRS